MVLLKTKFNIPLARPQTVPRSRLLEKLKEGLNYNLVLVSAPAGFGKTTLLSEWARQEQPRVRGAWLSLDEGDNDPTRFWDYFITAVRAIQPRAGEAAQLLLQSSQPPPIESVLTLLINDLAVIPGYFFIVLDDYHLIVSQPVHKGITYLLEHMPAQMHLVVAARGDPPLPISRFRGKGMMLEIRTDDLRFTNEEAARLLELSKSPGLSIKDVAALNGRTEGWAAGLKMAILSARGQADISQFITAFTGSQRYVMDYLMEEVLQQQPGEIRRFLLETSILEKLSGDLCDAVTGGTRGQEILAKLESGSLFTVPLDLPHAWYRYEHLFAELLRHELKTEHGDERVAGLHRRASEWFEKHALPEDAIHHALSARDWAGALRLIVAVNPIATYGGFTTYNWLHNIPPEALSTNPSAWINYAWALAMTGRVKAALEFMDTGEKSIGYYTKIKCYLDVVRTYIYSLQLDPRAEECAREALLRLPPGDGVNHMTVSSMLGGYYLRSGRYKDAEPLIAEAGEFYQRAGNAVDAANSLTSLALIMLLRGKLRQAEEMFQRAIDIGGGHPNAGYAQVYLEVLHYQRNELEKAAEDHGKALLENPGSSELRGTVDLYLVLLHLTRGDTEGAAAALKKAEQSMITDESTVMDRARIAAQHVAVAAAMDDSEATNHWLDELEKYEGIFIYDAPTIAMHLLYSRQGPAIKEKLQAEYERLQREDLKLYMIMMRLHQALIASQPGEALALLAEAMAMGQPEGIIRAFTDFGMSLDPLLRKAIGAGTEPDYARQLLTIIEEEEHRRKVRKGEIPASSRGAALLTLREIELVRLMAKGYSNQQIAKELVISLSTTKNHVHNILDKLNARSRTQAIVQARQLGLI